MKKIIYIFLTSDCGKLPNHGSTVNTVVDKKESEVVSTPPRWHQRLLLSLQKLPLLNLSQTFTPTPTSETNETVPALSDRAVRIGAIRICKVAFGIILANFFQSMFFNRRLCFRCRNC